MRRAVPLQFLMALQCDSITRLTLAYTVLSYSRETFCRP